MPTINVSVYLTNEENKTYVNHREELNHNARKYFKKELKKLE